MSMVEKRYMFCGISREPGNEPNSQEKEMLM